MFKNREEAAKKLADRLREHIGKTGVVLAIPRGGLVIGRILANSLGMPLEAVVAKKIPAPGQPELAIGAVCGDAVSWNHEVIAAFGVSGDYMKNELERVKKLVAEKEKKYRNRPLDLKNKICIITDDGIATGHTMFAAVEWARKSGAVKIVVAIPVGPAETVERLMEMANEVVCLETPPNFMAVGQFYGDFHEVSDEAAGAFLTRG